MLCSLVQLIVVWCALFCHLMQRVVFTLFIDLLSVHRRLFKLSCSIVQAIFKMLLCCGFLGNTKWARICLIFDFGAPGVPPKVAPKIEVHGTYPCKVSSKHPGTPTPTIFVPPPENQLMLWNVSDGPWVGFWYGGLLRPIIHCVVRKFGYLQK